MPGGVVFDQGNVNIASLTAPGAYVQIIPPLGISVPLPTNSMLLEGTASWGQMNKPTLSASPTTSVTQFGQFNQALNDPFDLARDTLICFQQAQTANSLSLWQVRIGDGTEAPASVVLMDTSGTPVAGATANGFCPGIGGNAISVQIVAGSVANSFSVQVIAKFAGLQNEFYPNIPGSASGASPFWTNLAAALANGLSNYRGPSQLLALTNVSNSAHNPAAGTFNLSGGTDGRSGVTAASFVGSDVMGARSGIFAGRNLSPTPSFMVCSGLTDSTKFASLQAMGRQEIIMNMFPFPLGTTTAAAVSAKQALGIDDYRCCFIVNWIYWTDPISGKQLLVSPAPFAAARLTTLSPELSPTNVAVYGVNGTERNGPQGNTPLGADEIGLLQTNGILTVSNPVPGGNYWGFPVGNNSSSDPIRCAIEYSRMIDYIGLSLAARMGKYVGKNQGFTDPDDTRIAAKNELDSFGDLLKNTTKQIDAWYSQCDASLNTKDTIPKRFFFANFFARLKNSIQFVVINLQGGGNVNTDPTTFTSGTLSNS